MALFLDMEVGIDVLESFDGVADGDVVLVIGDVGAIAGGPDAG